MKKLLLILGLLLLPSLAFANQSAQGFCEQGNRKVIVSGLNSVTTVQQSYPQCLVSVFLHGTNTFATLYSDNNATPTPLANPFTANSVGHWQFYANNGNYDVVLSGGTGTLSPYTISDIVLGDTTQNCSLFPGTNYGQKVSNCITALPSTGGTADVQVLLGSQAITSQLAISKSNVTILMGATTITCSGISPSQSPFVGGCIQINGATNVWIRGVPGRTKLFLAAGETIGGISFYDDGVGVIGGGVTGVELDGNKANNTSGTDDTFQTGILINNSAGTVDTAVTIEGCRIHDFNHYGITTYGATGLASGNFFTNNLIYSNGKNDAQGTGDGIYINRGSSRNTIANNRIYSNQRSGIRFSSAGTQQYNNVAIGNIVYSNGIDGIRADEDTDIGSIADVGQSFLIWVGNEVKSNTQVGLRLSTSNNVGLINYFTLSNNVVTNNGSHGISLAGNNSATSYTGRGTLNGNVSSNNTGRGLVITTTAKNVAASDNILLNNTIGSYDIAGSTNTVLSGNTEDTTTGNYIVNGTGALDIRTTANPGAIITTASGTTSALQLGQTGVASWNIQNKATTGTLIFNQGGSDRLTLDTSSNAVLGGKLDVGAEGIGLTGQAFASLGSPLNGTLKFCSNCVVTSGADNTCIAGVGQALAVRISGAWRCFALQN